MAKHKWAKEIHAWADGEVIEGRALSDEWIEDNNPCWDNPYWEFRIADPYRELKEALAAGKEIWWRHDSECPWMQATDPGWAYPPSHYQIRDKPKPKRKVKLYQWLYRINRSELITTTHRESGPDVGWSKRLDETMIEVEVEDD